MLASWELSLRGTMDDISRFKFRCDCWESRNPQKMTLQEVFSWNLVSNDEIYTRIFFFCCKATQMSDSSFLFRKSIQLVGLVGCMAYPFPGRTSWCKLVREASHTIRRIQARCQLSELIARCTRNLYSLKKHILTHTYIYIQTYRYSIVLKIHVWYLSYNLDLTKVSDGFTHMHTNVFSINYTSTR